MTETDAHAELLESCLGEGLEIIVFYMKLTIMLI